MTDQIVEPALQDALDRAKETANRIIESTANPTESIKEIQHMGSELADIYKDVNWMRVNTNLFNPTCYQNQLEELVEIQKNTIEDLFSSQEQLLEKATSKQINPFTDQEALAKPQALMANLINLSLDNYDSFATSVREQATAMGKLQTTYFDWCKKTLSELSKPHS